MVDPSIHTDHLPPIKAARLRQGFVSIFAIAFCFVIPHYAQLTIFIYPIVVLVITWLLLKYFYKENFTNLLFSFKRFEFKAAWIGIAAAILLSCFFQFVWGPFIDKILPSGKIDYSDFSGIRGNISNYIITLLLALVVGGFYEEIIFHGFIFTRFEKMFRGKNKLALSLVLSNIIFGLYHCQMGIKEVLLAMIAGFAYHILILKFNRNLWYGLFFHACFDFIGITLIFLGYLS